MKKRGRYPKEFKVEAVRLLNEGIKRGSEIAMELGIKRTLLYRLGGVAGTWFPYNDNIRQFC